MNKIIHFFTILTFVTIYAEGQTSVIQAPQIIPKSPEMKGIERYGEYPVSEYTGIPSINIPLHTIKLKDIDFPISLDYHSTGIQVTQEATWIGLGWNLILGGSVSTISVGSIDGPFNTFAQPDEWTRILNYTPYYFKEGDPRQFTEDGFRLWSNVCGQDPDSNSQTPNYAIMDGLKGSGERDIYNISILGSSFNVSIHPVSKQFIFNGEKNKFKIQKNGWLSWTITDENGYKYIFSDIESYKTGSSIEQNSTWYLTRIEYVGLTEPLLEINYASAYPIYLPNLSENITSTTYLTNNQTDLDNAITRNYDNNLAYKQLYVSSIIGAMDSIAFIRKDRVDVRNASALDQIIFFDRGTKEEVKRYKFEHDYFVGINNGANETTYEFVKKRLKLTKMYEQNGTQIKGVYSFTYNEKPLPYKTSFAQDLWGYYNGQDNKTNVKINSVSSGDQLLYSTNRTLIPDPIFASLNQPDIPKGFDDFRAANRGVDKDFITAGILESITYPTGGKTEFEFEPHKLNNYSYPPATSISGYNFVKSMSVINNGNSSYSTPSLIFENEKEVTAKIKVYIRASDYTIAQMSSFYVMLTVAGKGITPKKYMILTDAQKIEFNNKKSVSIEEDVILPVGRVTLSTSVLSGMPYQGYELKNGVQATLTFPNAEYKEDLRKKESLGGGIRLKNLKNYVNNTVTSIKTYTYPSNGKLINPLHIAESSIKEFARSSPTGISGNTESRALGSLTSYNMYNYSSNGCTTIVGYDNVEVKQVSPVNSASTGKVVSEFINIPTMSYYPNFFYPLTKQYTNGKLRQKIVLDMNNDTISVEKHVYSIANIEYNYINVFARDNFIGSRDASVPFDPRGFCVTANPYAYKGSFEIYVYPTNNYNVYLTKKDEIIYYKNEKVTKSTTYDYDLFNYKLKKVTENASGKSRITEYKYTLNYGSGEFMNQANMVSLNMIGTPIEEFLTINTIPVQSKKTEFFTFGNIISPSAVLIKNGTGPYKTRLQYESYNSFGNPQYITIDDASKIVYIWGYNNQYPIAEIKNATYAQITAIIPATILEAIAKKKVPTDSDFSQINNLRTNNSLKKAHVTTFRYKPLIGITEITDSKGLTTYYGYDSFNRLKESFFEVNKIKQVIQAYDYYYKK